MTTLLPPNVKVVHLALGYIDMRKGIDGLTMLVQGVLQQDPFTGHLFVFRGRTRTNLIKIIYWDGTGFCLFTKRLEHGVFLWPPSLKAGETLSLTSTQLSLLIEGVDERGLLYWRRVAKLIWVAYENMLRLKIWAARAREGENARIARWQARAAKERARQKDRRVRAQAA